MDKANWRPPSAVAEDRNRETALRNAPMALLAAAVRGGRGSQLYALRRVMPSARWRSPFAVAEDRNHTFADSKPTFV